MSARRVALTLLLASCLAGAAARAQDAYPDDITPPPGTQYPCALTALPRGLPGIPEADRAYLNRTYARILRATQAKLVLLRALESGQGVAPALARYQDALAPLMERQQADVVPGGLEAFQRDVVAALDLQLAFFVEASRLRSAGSGMEAVYRVGAGRQASSRLIAAWSAMQSRYPSWPSATRDSVYHHLCALDLF